jgi:hypothetical protein
MITPLFVGVIDYYSTEFKIARRFRFSDFRTIDITTASALEIFISVKG